jgi:hypothetical protein
MSEAIPPVNVLTQDFPEGDTGAKADSMAETFTNIVY